MPPQPLTCRINFHIQEPLDWTCTQLGFSGHRWITSPANTWLMAKARGCNPIRSSVTHSWFGVLSNHARLSSEGRFELWSIHSSISYILPSLTSKSDTSIQVYWLFREHHEDKWMVLTIPRSRHYGTTGERDELWCICTTCSQKSGHLYLPQAKETARYTLFPFYTHTASYLFV